MNEAILTIFCVAGLFLIWLMIGNWRSDQYTEILAQIHANHGPGLASWVPPLAEFHTWELTYDHLVVSAKIRRYNCD